MTPEDCDPGQVVVGIETDRGPWVAALVAAGYRCTRSTRCRRPGTGNGTASPAPRATPRTRTCWPTWSAPTPTSCAPVAGDSRAGEAVKVVARAHQTLIWERTRHVQRLRHALREFFPAALEAFDDLTAPDALELLAKAPDPAVRPRLTTVADHRGAQAGPPPRRPGQGRSDPGGAAQRAAGPAAARGRRLRRHRPRRRSLIADRLNEQISASGRAGRGPFWPAPGR